MKLLSWNVNHRTQRKPIPNLIPEAIQVLAPDLLVLTEYVRGPSHADFLARLANIGLRHAIVSPEARGENSVLIVCRRSLAFGGVSAPAVAPSMPYNFLHVELPEDRLQVMGIRIPDYSRQAQMRKACWDWFCSVAAEVVSDPTVITLLTSVDDSLRWSRFSIGKGMSDCVSTPACHHQDVIGGASSCPPR